MLHQLYPLLSHPWGGVAIALSVAAIGLVAIGGRRLLPLTNLRCSATIRSSLV